MNPYLSKAREKYSEFRLGNKEIPDLDEVGTRCLIDNGFELRVILSKFAGKYLAFFAGPTSYDTFLYWVSSNQFKNTSIEIPEIRRDLCPIVVN